MRRVRIRLRGIVQGVGFRPFVHHLAGKWQLAGYVLNSSAGLVAEVEGDALAVWLIPHTIEVTNLREKHPGDLVNLEFDLLGKYVEKLLAVRA